MEGKIPRFWAWIGMTAGELFMKSKKIAAPKKNSTFAVGFLITFLKI
jgi:hypothetical protein